MINWKKIIIHCSDTRIDQSFTAKDIDVWHKKRGWSGIGYHYVILQNGTVEVGRSLNKKGAHCKGENHDSIGVCFMGGKDEKGKKWESPTGRQIEAFRKLEIALLKAYGDLEVYGHYEFSSKTCPNFEVCMLWEY